MAPDQDTRDRDRAVRRMLVEQVTEATPAPLFAPERFRTGLVTAIVLVAIVALSIVAVRFGSDREAPAQGGVPASGSLPTPTALPAGKLLGRFTSDDGPNQTHTIHPNGLAISAVFSCAGVGDYLVSIAHESDFGDLNTKGLPPGRCDGDSASSGDKGHAGPATVRITSAKAVRWTLTIVGIPETYVTPQPVVSPTDSTGTAVRFCTAADLSVRYETVKLSPDVTEAAGGQLDFTNTSATPCAVAGTPAVRFLRDGAALGKAAQHGDARNSEEKGLKPVVVRSGGHAYSQVDYYLPNYYDENDTGKCQELALHDLRVDLANDFAGAAQVGTFDVATPTITGCTNSAWGIFGTYGQLSSSIFVDYSLR